MQETTHRGLSPTQANALLEELLGHAIPPHDFYNLVTRGALVPIPDTHPRRFTEDAVRTVAEQQRTIEAAQKEQAEMLGTQDALRYLHARDIPIQRGRFRSTLNRLVEQRKVDPPKVIPYPSRPHHRFPKETLDVVAKTLSPDEATAGMLTTRQAAEYLSQTRGRVVPPDLIYHKIRRKTLVPDVIAEGRYYFCRETLDAVDVGTQRQPRKPVEPVADIQYIADIRHLEKRLGAHLLTGRGVLRVLKDRTGRSYTPESIKQMRRYGRLHPVAQLGRTLLYRESDVHELRVLPRTGRHATKREEPHEETSVV
jgi:hypothetical protein